ncbi:alpha/beta hydrolase fold domain-containing protein [Glutamicibacter sp. NPDC087344]|uniref:alpha/beta hydrolase fold domain-containing protein n=1 Tax=Glutamicibacter sp. NPDC087344 TaxID=3363994 RepID=UPI0038271909
MTTPSFSYPVRREAALEYAGGNGAAQLMDLYLPHTGATSVPVVIWLHGGGWFTGDRTLAPDLAATAARTGIAFASIEYRLSGEATFPAPLDDVIAAIRHLRIHGSQWGLDAERIGLWGASAGAHLAALSALTASSAEADAPADAQVSCVVACYPPVDLELIINQRPAGKTWDQTPEGRLLGVEPNTAAGQAIARAANPLTHLSAQAPPFLLCHGTADVLVPHLHSQKLFDQLQSAGVHARLYLLEGYRHGFVNPPGRLDVEIAAVMDDGRLETEVSAAAVAQVTGHPDSQDVFFGFTDIENFLSERLGVSDSNPQTTTRPLTTSGDIPS